MMNYRAMTKAELIQILELRERPVRCSDPRTVVDYLKEYENEEQEHFIVLVLDGANNIKFSKCVTIGITNRTLVHPREVFNVAITHCGTSIIVAHNHPSGCLEPSADDLEVTLRLRKAGQLLGINVLDHVIFGRGQYHSLAESGELL